MPPRRPRADADESRMRILDAAETLIIRFGYAGMSISQVSADSGLSASSIYWHFGSKWGLVSAVLERGIDRYVLTAEAAAGNPEAGPHAELDTLFRVIAESPEALRLALIIGLVEPFEGPIGEAHLRGRLHGREVIRAAIARTLGQPLESDEVDRWATFAHAALDGAVIANHIDGVDLSRVLDPLVWAIEAAAARGGDEPQAVATDRTG
jgi:AcrR family transcriptional regulator